MTERPKRNGEVTAPIWVAVITYLICWPLGGWAFQYGVTHSSIEGMIGGGVLLLFPVAGFRPLEVIRDLLGR